MSEHDWRPRLSQIEHPIADDHWRYVTPGGERRLSRVMVGRPSPWPEAGAWYCPVMIEGHTSPEILPIFGSGPVDALMNAMAFVRRFFEENSLVEPVEKSSKPVRRRRKAGKARG